VTARVFVEGVVAAFLIYVLVVVTLTGLAGLQ
jgi:hypothetical protein